MNGSEKSFKNTNMEDGRQFKTDIGVLCCKDFSPFREYDVIDGKIVEK